MNALAHGQLFMRSLATRRQHLATSAVLADTVQLLKSAGFDLVVVETAGIGQSDTEIVDLVDLSMYVMTSDYGAASQLEKIDMLDFADFIALNKFEKRGAEDALRDVRKQVSRNRKLFKMPPEQLPVYPTIASQFNDPGVNALFGALCVRLHEQWGRLRPWQPEGLAPLGLPKRQAAATRTGRHSTPPTRPAARTACIARSSRSAIRRSRRRSTAIRMPRWR
jgi:methylmalonyl-CoA mutase